MRFLYLVLCIVGAVLPLAQFLPWLAAHGLDVPLLYQQATETPVAAFAWSDVFVSGVAVGVLIIVEGRRLKMPGLWLPMLALLVGPSLALPLFLLQREQHVIRTGKRESFDGSGTR